MAIKGIDVSYAQPGFNWAAAPGEGLDFGYCKRSEGTAGVDNQFDNHFAGIGQNDLVRGAYHFSRWDLGTAPNAEALFFLNHLPTLDVGDFVVLDLENSPENIQPQGDLSWWALTWLDTVEHVLGFPPMVYSGSYFASQYLTDGRLAKYGLIAAAYGPTCPGRIGPWSGPAMWQHTASSTHCGSYPIDEDFFFGTAQQLQKYGKPGAVLVRPPVGQPNDGVIRFQTIQPMQLRRLPAIYCPPMGPLLPKGTIVAEVAPPAAMPQETPHWLYCRTGGDVRGYLYKDNLVRHP